MWSSGVISFGTAQSIFPHYKYRGGMVISVRSKYVKHEHAPLFDK